MVRKVNINVPYIAEDRTQLYENLLFKEINEGVFVLQETPLEATEYKKGEIYYIHLGAPVATRIQSMAEYIKNTLTWTEVEELMKRLSQ